MYYSTCALYFFFSKKTCESLPTIAKIFECLQHDKLGYKPSVQLCHLFDFRTRIQFRFFQMKLWIETDCLRRLSQVMLSGISKHFNFKHRRASWFNKLPRGRAIEVLKRNSVFYEKPAVFQTFPLFTPRQNLEEFFRLKFHFLRIFVKDELAVLQQRGKVGLPIEIRITFSFCSLYCYRLVFRFPVLKTIVIIQFSCRCHFIPVFSVGSCVSIFYFLVLANF